jgi:hypothetical protein
MVFWIGGYCTFNSKCFNLPVGETVLAGRACNHGFALQLVTISEDAFATRHCNERSELVRFVY